MHSGLESFLDLIVVSYFSLYTRICLCQCVRACVSQIGRLVEPYCSICICIMCFIQIQFSVSRKTRIFLLCDKCRKQTWQHKLSEFLIYFIHSFILTSFLYLFNCLTFFVCQGCVQWLQCVLTLLKAYQSTSSSYQVANPVAVKLGQTHFFLCFQNLIDFYFFSGAYILLFVHRGNNKNSTWLT